MSPYRLRRARVLRGTVVRNGEGEKVGEIDDLALDQLTGGIAYVVLSVGGFLGIGDKLVAVPWDALQQDHLHAHLLLDVPRKVLSEAPGFDRKHWPQHPDTSFLDKVYSHYGYKTYLEHREESYGHYLERKRAAHEGTTLDVVDPKRGML